MLNVRDTLIVKRNFFPLPLLESLVRGLLFKVLNTRMDKRLETSKKSLIWIDNRKM